METKPRVKVSERMVLLLTPEEMKAFSELAAEKRLPKAVLMRDAMEIVYPKIFKRKKAE